MCVICVISTNIDATAATRFTKYNFFIPLTLIKC